MSLFEYKPSTNALRAMTEYEHMVKNRKKSDPPIAPPLMFVRDGLLGFMYSEQDRLYYEREMERIRRENEI